VGGAQDGHGEKVRESQRLVHYGYKNWLEDMTRKFSCMLLPLLILTGCDDEIIKEEKSRRLFLKLNLLKLNHHYLTRLPGIKMDPKWC